MTEAKKSTPKRKPRATTTKKKAVAHKPRKAAEVVVPVAHVKQAQPRRTYLFSVGRRKTAIARVRYYATATGEFVINEKPLHTYFPTARLQQVVNDPLKHTGDIKGQFSVKVHGGGLRSQALAVRLGIARILVMHDAETKSPLKKLGFLTRDSRAKERKKYGLRRARRAPQWQKR